ncbi:P-loop NTPase fold protein [Paraburkholderia bryophila]|uniref:P-loop NTPase fold protein n=1 Tax=Paraburkholderia bryophila TaxID=420952 RepID=UPI0038B92EF3
MSQQHVQEVITSFINSTEPEVLAVSGPWGIGKTFAIRNIISKYKGTGSLPTFAYVSAFGAQSLAGIRSAIMTAQRGLPISEENVLSTRDQIASRVPIREIWNQLRDVNLFGIKHIVVAAETLAGALVRDTLVVLDDVERLSKTIQMQDLMGLVSELKEQHRCRVILILNSEKLGDNLGAFDQYSEKVIDQKLEFVLSSEEAASLGLADDTPLRGSLIDYMQRLEISNIRVIKKIERAVKMIFPIIEGRSATLHQQLPPTVCVFAAALYERGRGFATPDDILKYNKYLQQGRRVRNNAPEEPDPIWVALLERCGFTNADDFDQAILKTMERGYVAGSEIDERAAQLDAVAHRDVLKATFSAAWDLFHDRLDVTVEQLTKTLSDAVKEAAVVISPVNMNATVRLMRQLGQDVEADAAIDEWARQNRTTPSTFDLDHEARFGDIDDEVFEARCREEFAANREQLTLQQAVDIIVENKRWHEAIARTLATASKDELVSLLKQNQGPNLNKIVTGIQQAQGEDGEREAIRRTLGQALVAIGEESSVNRLRVKRWGVNLGEQAAEVAPI